MFSEDGPPTAMQTALVNLVNKDIQRSTIEYIPLLVQYTTQMKLELDDLMKQCDLTLT